MKIAIVGLGFVGSAVKHGFEVNAPDTELLLIDRDLTRSNASYADLSDECSAIFVSVPTPSSDDGSCDTSILESVLSSIALSGYKGLVISKSTAPASAYTALHQKYPSLVHAPEFLTELNANRDYLNSEFLVLGGGLDWCYLAQDISRISQPKVSSVVIGTIAEAALAKYTINSFLATKVVFMNELHDLCVNLGSSYKKVVAMASQDARIGKSHLKVPGTHGFGFSGTCFPKDTKSLAHQALVSGTTLSLLRQAVSRNEQLRLRSQFEPTERARLHERNEDFVLFSGVEREGPRIGTPTLFVKNHTSDRLPLLQAHLGVNRQVYFGAGGQSPVTKDVWSTISTLYHKEHLYELLYAVEVTSFDELPDRDTVASLRGLPLLVIFNVRPLGATQVTTLDWSKVEYVEEILGFQTIWKMDVGGQCVFMYRYPTVNTFDGYPEDTILYSARPSQHSNL